MNLSVIIPIYNSSQWLEKCLSCYFSQTYDSVEYILIDDGSTDESFSICSAFQEKYNNVRLIHQSNKGVSFARNVGLEMAQGEYISFLDSDDYIDCEMLSEMMNLAVVNDLDIVSCGISMELEMNNRCYVQSQVKFCDNVMVLNRIEIKEQMLNMWEKSVPYNICNKIYRKKVLTENNIRFSNLYMGEDLEFNMSFFRVCNSIGFLPQCYYHYIRERNDSATSRYIQNWFSIRKQENERIKKFFLDYLECSKLPSEYDEFASRRFVIRSLACIENECRRKDTRNEFVKTIVNDGELQKAIMVGGRYSLTIKLLMWPIKHRIIGIVMLEAMAIGNIRKRFPRVYEYFKFRKT